MCVHTACACVNNEGVARLRRDLYTKSMWRLVLGTSLLVIFILVLAEARGGDPASLYDVLGVSRDASQREIRSAYKREAREWHPDKNKSPEAQDKIVQINKAYEVCRSIQSNLWYK